MSIRKEKMSPLIRPHSCVSAATVRSLLQIHVCVVPMSESRQSDNQSLHHFLFLGALDKAKLILSRKSTSFVISADMSLPPLFIILSRTLKKNIFFYTFIKATQCSSSFESHQHIEMQSYTAAQSRCQTYYLSKLT